MVAYDRANVTIAGADGDALFASVIGDSERGRCLAAGGFDAQFDMEYTLDVSDGPGIADYSVTTRIPSKPRVECQTPVVGQEFVINWEPVGADNVRIKIGGPFEDFSVDCQRMPDNGQLVVPIELMEVFETDRIGYYVSAYNRTEEVLEGTTLLTFAAAWSDCPGDAALYTRRRLVFDALSSLIATGVVVGRPSRRIFGALLRFGIVTFR